MPAPIDILTAVSAAAFLFYGLACVLSAKLVAEFERYQLARWRVRDPWYAMLPAFVLAVINLAIVLRAN